MKLINARFALPFAMAGALTACVAAPAPTPAPAPVVTPTPAPTPEPIATAEPVYDNWMDAPQTPGNWQWRRDGTDSIAEFRSPNGSMVLQMACVAKRQIFVSIPGGSPGRLTVRTETASRTLAASLGGMFARAALAPNDPLLDAMAISKGRFAVENGSAPTLYIPSWPEVTRVIEDCR